MGPFTGQVHSQTMPAELTGDPRALQAHFSGFLERSRRVTTRVRAAVAMVLVVALAFVASRVEQPVAVGLCGLLVIAPIVWLLTALLVPLSLLGRSKLAQGAGLTMRAGAAITVDAAGLLVDEQRFPWGAVTSISEEGGALVVRGVVAPQRLVFQVVLAAKNFGSELARREVLVGLERLRVAAPQA